MIYVPFLTGLFCLRPPQYPQSSSDDLKEKIIAQETRQAELNHYVKMVGPATL